MLNFGGVSDLLIWPAKFSKKNTISATWNIHPTCRSGVRFFQDFVSSDQAHEFSILVGFEEVMPKQTNRNQLSEWAPRDPVISSGPVVVANIFHVHPYLGKIPILTNIFQMGWNHQLGRVILTPLFVGLKNKPQLPSSFRPFIGVVTI